MERSVISNFPSTFMQGRKVKGLVLVVFRLFLCRYTEERCSLDVFPFYVGKVRGRSSRLSLSPKFRPILEVCNFGGFGHF